MKEFACKRRTRLYFFTVFLIISSFFIVSESSAMEEPYTIKSLYTSIRPEYDHPVGWADSEIPAVLVVNQLEIVNNTNEPITTFSFEAPIDAANFFVFATGKLREQGQYWPAPHILSEGKIHINLQNHPILPDEEYTLVVQYYYNPFEIDGIRKSFQFELAPDVTVPEVRFDVQLPPAGRNAKVEPAKYALSTVTENHISRDNPIKVDISYEKADNIPTNRPLTNQSSESSGSIDIKLVAFILLLSGIVFAGFSIFRSNDVPSGKRVGKKTPNSTERSKRNQKSGNTHTNQAKQRNQTKQTRIHIKKESISNEQKQLRKQLLAGEIDEATYQQKMKELN